MPVHVQKDSKTGKWLIVGTATGKVKGRSTSKKKAHISASYRNQAIKGKR